MKYCAQCGAPNADEAASCEKCGSAWGAVAQPAPAAATPTVASRRNNAVLLIALAVVAVLVVVGAAVGWLLFLKPMDAGEYEAAVSATYIHSVKSFDTWYATLSENASDDDEISAEVLDSMRSATSRLIREVTADRDDIARLRPPKQHEAAHQDLVRGYDDILEVYESVDGWFDLIQPGDSVDSIQELPGAESINEINPVGEEMKMSLKDMGLWDAIAEELGYESGS